MTCLPRSALPSTRPWRPVASIRDVDDMEDIIDGLLMRRKSGKYIAQTLANFGFGRVPYSALDEKGVGVITEVCTRG